MNFNYTFGDGTDYVSGSFPMTFLMIYAMIIVIVSLGSIAGYVFRSIGFYTIAKNQGDENAWLAFIPVVRRYQQGKLAGDILLKTRTIKNTGIWFVLLPVAWGIISYLTGMIIAISVVAKVIRYEMMNSYNGYGLQAENIVGSLFIILIICAILSAVYQVIYKLFMILIDKAIYEKYTTGNMPVIHAVFSALVPLYEAVCVFIISRKSGNSKKEPQPLIGEVISENDSSAEDACPAENTKETESVEEGNTEGIAGDVEEEVPERSTEIVINNEAETEEENKPIEE